MYFCHFFKFYLKAVTNVFFPSRTNKENEKWAYDSLVALLKTHLLKTHLLKTH
jgi:hypothetical protein